MLIPVELPPGQYRNGTALQSAGRWRDASLVRWYEGTVRAVGGWSDFVTGLLPQKARAAHAWRTLSGSPRLAVGMADNLYIYGPESLDADITPADLIDGRETGELADGFGSGPFGRGAFGSDYATTERVLDATIWTLANWGEDLIACSDYDGRIFQWSPGSTDVAAVISAAPTGNAAICVSENRFLFALGAGGDGRKVAWCDREDYTVWDSTATNEAGGFILNTVGAIQCGVPLRGQTLILTDQDAHVANYVGPQLVHEFERVGMFCGTISKNAVETVADGAIWMGFGGFYTYAGGRVSELPCEVSDYVFGRLSRTLQSGICSVQISQFNEVWWFYASTDATENDSYVSYNYVQNTWQTGSLARTAGVERGVYYYPMLFGADKKISLHEKGNVPAGNDVFAETGPISLGTGETTFTARRVHTDEDTQGGVKFTFKTRRHPNGPETVSPAYAPENPMGVRFTGRQMVMRIEGNEGEDWRVGVQRVEVAPRGRR